MSRKTTMFNAFTGMGLLEKRALVNFIRENSGVASSNAIQEALDYALKRKPSFGGFVVTAHENHQLIGAIVVNQTGMEGYNPNNICVFVAIDHSFEHKEEVLCQLMGKAISYTNGDIAMHIEPDNPTLQLYQKMGFKAQYLELRLDKEPAIA
jgi:ribosomal-protein-alanine N-acetyltransferase